jgi:hypothetical protein
MVLAGYADPRCDHSWTARHCGRRRAQIRRILTIKGPGEVRRSRDQPTKRGIAFRTSASLVRNLHTCSFTPSKTPGSSPP